MAFNGKYSQVNTGSETHFSQGIMGETEFSRMTSVCRHLTTFNAGDIVPVYCAEVLPHDTFLIDLESVIRQNTLLTPTMGNMVVDFYAFFVPNRVVNKSWKSVMGENVNGVWTASPVNLVPLVAFSGDSLPEQYQVPVGSVADYYGFPTQAPIPSVVLRQCNDLKFRGYVEIYNEFFRDQNYQPPIPYSKLNVFEGFFDYSDSKDDFFSVDGQLQTANVEYGQFPPTISLNSQEASSQKNGVGISSVTQGIYGNLDYSTSYGAIPSVSRSSSFNALGKPLKANKMHDYFTSVLPSPQKGPEVFVPASLGYVPVVTSSSGPTVSGSHPVLGWKLADGRDIPGSAGDLYQVGMTNGSGSTYVSSSQTTFDSNNGVYPDNLVIDPEATGIDLSINDLRMASAVQKVYEALGRGGSRYRSYIQSFFGIEVDDPFKDIPTYLGHIRRDLQLYQTAQTSASETGNTPQGNLAAFGYTEASGQLFAPFTAMEHGYIHIMCVVRHKNIYSSYLAPDNFRMNMMDFYQPQLANISEQPVYTKYINPFVSDASQVFGYQEAWAEYRYEPDRVSGYMRPGVSGSLSVWNYADDFATGLTIADSNFMKSNSQAVLDRTLAVTSAVAPQLKGQFVFKVDKQRPMPTYSVPGLDII